MESSSKRASSSPQKNYSNCSSPCAFNFLPSPFNRIEKWLDQKGIQWLESGADLNMKMGFHNQKKKKASEVLSNFKLAVLCYSQNGSNNEIDTTSYGDKQDIQSCQFLGNIGKQNIFSYNAQSTNQKELSKSQHFFFGDTENHNQEFQDYETKLTIQNLSNKNKPSLLERRMAKNRMKFCQENNQNINNNNNLQNAQNSDLSKSQHLYKLNQENNQQQNQLKISSMQNIGTVNKISRFGKNSSNQANQGSSPLNPCSISSSNKYEISDIIINNNQESNNNSCQVSINLNNDSINQNSESEIDQIDLEYQSDDKLFDRQKNKNQLKILQGNNQNKIGNLFLETQGRNNYKSAQKNQGYSLKSMKIRKSTFDQSEKSSTPKMYLHQKQQKYPYFDRMNQNILNDVEEQFDENCSPIQDQKRKRRVFKFNDIPDDKLISQNGKSLLKEPTGYGLKLFSINNQPKNQNLLNLKNDDKNQEDIQQQEKNNVNNLNMSPIKQVNSNVKSFRPRSISNVQGEKINDTIIEFYQYLQSLQQNSSVQKIQKIPQIQQLKKQVKNQDQDIQIQNEQDKQQYESPQKNCNGNSKYFSFTPQKSQNPNQDNSKQLIAQALNKDNLINFNLNQLTIDNNKIDLIKNLPVWDSDNFDNQNKKETVKQQMTKIPKRIDFKQLHKQFSLDIENINKNDQFDCNKNQKINEPQQLQEISEKIQELSQEAGQKISQLNFQILEQNSNQKYVDKNQKNGKIEIFNQNNKQPQINYNNHSLSQGSTLDEIDKSLINCFNINQKQTCQNINETKLQNL
ncbi:hypothetical protein PPERSA_09604 [Pseudocohnilembus persalinus]|uniref:Uncharacterized protein n=1 Tax=Pseudocohnilembus persalinus TaxID=266149 RepID=A0A0V0QFL6_PSEPJ|nr:hypothetical protein PPERSA_09604 [Pseudocohnilembus persalinus]|eukprot:KRX00998.1 hypothetical protein PPERSA_09604 [Pseudocohnilembus persalinus]